MQNATSKHHFNLGQFMALALIGLQAYHVSQSAGASAFLNPAVVEPFLAGVASIFTAQNPAPVEAAPPAPEAPAPEAPAPGSVTVNVGGNSTQA